MERCLIHLNVIKLVKRPKILSDVGSGEDFLDMT